jgi:hypothetical protein
MVMLGNLSVQQIEERLGIELTDEERAFLSSSRQQRAEGIAKDKWHCFDIPFVMVCGSQETAMKVCEILRPYESKMTDAIRIVIAREV